jgi:hypothetical protein
MDKVIKEILTNKEARNNSTLALLVATAIGAGTPWLG